MKEYFSHDYNARNDPKLLKLRQKMGWEGVGIYWAIIEMLNEQDGYLKLSECDCIAFALQAHIERITSIISDFELFKNDGEKFWSESVLKRISSRVEKSGKAANSAQIRWKNANALRPECDRNAIKESKVKEIKEKEKSISAPETGKIVLLCPEHLKDPIERFREMRKKEKHPPTDYALKLIIKKLIEMYPDNPDMQIASINQSIERGYRGVFPVDAAKPKMTNFLTGGNGGITLD